MILKKLAAEFNEALAPKGNDAVGLQCPQAKPYSTGTHRFRHLIISGIEREFDALAGLQSVKLPKTIPDVL